MAFPCPAAALLGLAAATSLSAQAPLPPVAPQLTVTITARAVQPGEVLRVDIESGAELGDVGVEVFGRRILAAAVAPGTWRALAGIDLGVAPGEYAMTVTATTASSLGLRDDETVIVEDKVFPTRELHVDPRFVRPPARVVPRIEREAKRLSAIFAAESADPAWPGPMTVPIASAMISGFGVRSVFNGEPRAPHAGADFASPTGTPVKAPGPGRVVLVAALYFTGTTVVIDHGRGLYSLFAHLSETSVREGQPVTRGALLGRVGATGRATGPHLHWTVRLHGARVDPLSLVEATSTEPAAAP